MVSIDIDNFDEQKGELAVDLTFESLDDFLPGSIARKITGLNKLLEARKQLASLIMYMDGKAGAEEPGYHLEGLTVSPRLVSQLP
jgi:type VI secretion system protein ImpB